MRAILEPGCRAFALLFVILAVGAVLLAWAYFVEPRMLTVTHHEIPVAGLPDQLDGSTIVLLSDLHGARFGPGQQLLVDVVARQQPQAIVFAGDLVDANRGGHVPGLELLTGLSKIAPTFLIWGNHDYTSGLEHLRELVDQGGIRVHDLDAGWASLELPGGTILFCGLSRSWRSGGHGLVEQASAARAAHPDAAVLVAVAHSPGPDALAHAIAAGADLMLAGHTHGGQIRLPIIGALWSPVDGYLPEQAYGQYPMEPGWLFVTRGLGTSVLPLRFMCPPEVAVLTIRTGPAQR